MKLNQIFLVSWLFLVFYLALKVSMSMGITIPGGPVTTSILFFAFGFMLCTMFYGKKDALIFFLIVFIIGWLYESCSILTGFPFGKYYYSDVLGPKLWNVPYMVMLMYFGMGAVSWFVAHVLLGKYDNVLKGRDLLLIPIISAFVMVMWDVSLDPIASTITGEWVWVDGGPYFGVPFVNFLGWFLCVLTFYLIFTLYQSRKKPNPKPAIMKEKTAWLLPVAGYLAVIIAMPIAAIYSPNYQITSLDGHVWWTSDIRWSMVLVAMYSMLFIVILSMIRLNEGFGKKK